MHSRFSAYTYGIRTMEQFRLGVDPIENLVRERNERRREGREGERRGKVGGMKGFDNIVL